VARAQHELDLLQTLLLVLSVTKGQSAPEREPVLTRAAALCQQVGEPPQHGAVLYALWGFHFTRAKHQAAQAMAEQLLDLAQRQSDPVLLLRAHHALGQTLFHLGAFAPARTHLEQVITLSDPHQHETPPHTARLASVLGILGYLDRAMQQTQEALTMARAQAEPFSLVFTLLLSTQLHDRYREWQTVQAHAEAMLALATEHGFARFVAHGIFSRGRVLAVHGQHSKGIAQMRQGLADLRATGTALGMPTFLARLGEAYGQAGQVDQGLRLLTEALALADTTGERAGEAELHRLYGELRLRQAVPDAPAAAACFQQALAVARHQQARVWELRAAMSLCRLWQQHGKRAAAYELLAPIYGWFTEGFDTPDRLEAKALLSKLA
jgi:predicted ATPase